MSQQVIGKGRALLAALGLTQPQINQCYGTYPTDEEEAIQKGLVDWIGSKDPTWGELLTAMKTPGVPIWAHNDLEKKLCQ